MENLNNETVMTWRKLGNEFLETMEELGVLRPIWETTKELDSFDVDTSDMDIYEQAALERNSFFFY